MKKATMGQGTLRMLLPLQEKKNGFRKIDRLCSIFRLLHDPFGILQTQRFRRS
jgi:hypothetical protein